MARMRTVKPGFFTSEDVAALPLRARLTWIGLWTHCDDHGRTKELVKLIKAAVWPLDDVSLRDVEEDLVVLADGGAIVRYELSGARFVAVQNWHFHQSPNRPGDTRCPAPPVPVAVPAPGERGHCAPCWLVYERLRDPQAVDSFPGYPQESSLNDHGGLTPGGEGRRRGEGGEGNARARTPPPPGSRPRCQRHAHLPDDDPGPNCRDCRDVRVAAERAAGQPPPKPPWCGECDPDTRQVDRGGRVGRCHSCHPLRSVG